MPNVKRKWPWQGSLRSRPEKREQDLLAAPETTHSSSDESRPAPTRWVSEGQSDLSPYGFAEDDAGLRQVESGAWRRAFSGGGQSRTPHKQFVPMSSARTRPPSVNSNKPSYLSRTIVWQTFCALVLVGVVYYVDHHPDAVPPEVVSQAQTVLQTDYTADVAPSIDKAFADMHISAPQFGATTAVKLHNPVSGTIVEDYSSTHPEVSIAGTAKAPVLAAGSGTVLNVVNVGDTKLVRIDNGALGTTIYDGLGSVNVKAHEYVTAAEVIGKLPASPSHPALKFSIVKDGNYENPHAVVNFDGASP
ncbi:hypothetical protein AAC03nite_16080 [Alicyclobacillus acidoterrestris]|uniref:M23 family metallopeptidase n=1 Tax=Alicyclobacillus suci TaxID=2816080 RepID=UPI00119233FC|nr:M23 family metallopeptidase [Alicyclobacillus suci]GEO25823.1 hypothetical protein AAC03nite_16080 [Alicyclobacillus acidoterrestris]